MGVPGTKSNVKNNVELRYHTSMQVEPRGHSNHKHWVRNTSIDMHNASSLLTWICLFMPPNEQKPNEILESNVTIQSVYPITSNSIISPIFTKVSSGFPFYSFQQSAKARGIKRKTTLFSLRPHYLSWWHFLHTTCCLFASPFRSVPRSWGFSEGEGLLLGC